MHVFLLLRYIKVCGFCHEMIMCVVYLKMQAMCLAAGRAPTDSAGLGGRGETRRGRKGKKWKRGNGRGPRGMGGGEGNGREGRGKMNTPHCEIL